MFSRVETRFFQFCSFLNMWNNLRRILESLVPNGRLSTHLDSIFTKETVSSLPNTHAARIYMRVERSNLYLKTLLWVILTISKTVQDWVHFLISIPAIIIPATLTWVETFLNYYFFLINAGIPLCHFADSEPFHLNSRDSNKCPENAQPVTTLWWLF